MRANLVNSKADLSCLHCNSKFHKAMKYECLSSFQADFRGKINMKGC